MRFPRPILIVCAAVLTGSGTGADPQGRGTPLPGNGRWSSPLFNDIPGESAGGGLRRGGGRITRDAAAPRPVPGKGQEVPDLILSLNLYNRDAAGGGAVRTGAVDIRGNAEQGFRRGYRYLPRNIIFLEE